MKDYLAIPPLFTPARIIIEPAVEAVFEDFEIGGALWRHFRGDWGEWAHEEAGNYTAGAPLDCSYNTRYGSWLRIKTSADRSTTTVSKGERGEGAGGPFPDDE